MDLEKGFLGGFISPRSKRRIFAIFAKMSQFTTSVASSSLYEVATRATVILSTNLIFEQGLLVWVETLWFLPRLKRFKLLGISGMLRAIIHNFLVPADPGRLKPAPNFPVSVRKSY